MRNIFKFLKESDSETIRRSHRRRARELAAEMSQPASVDRKVMSMTVRSGPVPQGTVVSNRMDQNGGYIISKTDRRDIGVIRNYSIWPFEGGGYGTGINGLIVAPVHQT